MRRLVASLALALAVLLPAATPALALVGRVTLYDGFSGAGAVCGGFIAEDSDLSTAGGCGNWTNRASSVQNQVAVDGAAKSCVVYYDGTNYTGAAWANHSQSTVNIPDALNNAVSSFRFGTWKFIPAIGQYGCVDPYS